MHFNVKKTSSWIDIGAKMYLQVRTFFLEEIDASIFLVFFYKVLVILEANFMVI